MTLLSFILVLLIFGWFLDFFFPLILVSIFAMIVMTATHIVEWDGNTPDFNFERGVEYMNERKEQVEKDEERMNLKYQRMQDGEVIIK